MRLAVRSSLITAVCALVFLRDTAGAQAPATDAGPTNATREQLARLADSADAAASLSSSPMIARDAKRREAAAIRERLRLGDFRAGDQIVLAMQGDSSVIDTVTVRSGLTFKSRFLPEDTLAGVLRSDLQTHVADFVGRFYKTTRVRATVLIQLGILGEVNRPGYYRVPVDMLVSDAIMAAGGPTQRADMPATIVRRKSREVLSKAAVRDALASGFTLDHLGLAAGDELVVDAQRQRLWQTALQLGTFATGVVLALAALSR